MYERNEKQFDNKVREIIKFGVSGGMTNSGIIIFGDNKVGESGGGRIKNVEGLRG